MSRSHRWTIAVVTIALQSTPVLMGASSAFAHDAAATVDGRYHSVTNGIADYDGFDRFRDVNGEPLPGWRQMLGSPG
jgi:hypothetical protein